MIDVVDFNPFAGLVKAQEYVAKQYQHVTTIIPPRHPIPAYPDKVFTYYTCGTSNPYLIVTVRDQQVPIVDPSARLNLSTRAFAINTWAEIAYQDPTVPKYTFRIAEDLIYDVNNDTFAVAAPFDVKGGRKQVMLPSTDQRSAHYQCRESRGMHEVQLICQLQRAQVLAMKHMFVCQVG